MRSRLILISLAGAAVASLAGCSDDDGNGSSQAAQDYSLDVERISDDAGSAADHALVTLNRVTDGAIEPRRAVAILESESERVARESKRLVALTPPEPAAQTADDLEFQLDSLALEMNSAATDIRVAGGGSGSLAAAGRSNARVVLAASSGTSALSRALRALALESTE